MHGEPTEPVPAGQAPVLPDDRPLDDDFELSGYGELRTSRARPRPARRRHRPLGDDRVSLDGGPGVGEVGVDGHADTAAASVPAALDDDELAIPAGADDGDPEDDPDDELGPAPDEGQPDRAPSGRGRRGRGTVSASRA